MTENAIKYKDIQFLTSEKKLSDKADKNTLPSQTTETLLLKKL